MATDLHTGRFSLEGRVAVVTGAGTGIGRGTAQVLAEYGADLVIGARRVEKLERAASELRELGRRVLVVPTDVTDPEACQALIDRTLDEYGRVDVLVNNAGGGVSKPVMDWTVEEWHRVVDLNLGSVWFLSRAAAVPMLEQGKGAIVNISSGASLLALPMQAPYGAAKAGINNVTGTLSAAWSMGGIRVNALAVGAVKTDSFLEYARKEGIDEDAHGRRNGLARAGTPDEIAYAVLFLASDASSFVTGQTLWINGGPQAPPAT